MKLKHLNHLLNRLESDFCLSLFDYHLSCLIRPDKPILI